MNGTSRRVLGTGLLLGRLYLLLAVAFAAASCMVWAAYSGAGRGQRAGGLPGYVGRRRISGPTSMALAPDGRIFVTQKSGELRVISHG